MLTLHDETPPGQTEGALLRVTRYLRFVGCPASALDDLVQETLLAGVRQWPDGDAPLSWLLATARNQLRKLLRDQGRRREVVDLERLDELWQRHVPDGGDERGERLRHCLERLPERGRLALQLRYGDDLSLAEVGVRLGLGVDGAKSMLARLRAALQRCIGGGSDDGA
ncbi:MAG: RNA polymerase sigma factor [Planctomycetota bacterium]